MLCCKTERMWNDFSCVHNRQLCCKHRLTSKWNGLSEYLTEITDFLWVLHLLVRSDGKWATSKQNLELSGYFVHMSLACQVHMGITNAWLFSRLSYNLSRSLSVSWHPIISYGKQCKWFGGILAFRKVSASAENSQTRSVKQKAVITSLQELRRVFSGMLRLFFLTATMKHFALPSAARDRHCAAC